MATDLSAQADRDDGAYGKRPMSGGCLCGRIRYRADVDPAKVTVCHCRSCQRQTGSPFSEVAATLAASFVVEGAVATHVSVGDSGSPVHRSFCLACGSPIFSAPEAVPGVVYIKVGTLDEASSLRPTSQIYRADAHPWLDLRRLPGWNRARRRDG